MPISLNSSDFDENFNLLNDSVKNGKVIVLVHRTPGCMWCEKYMPDFVAAEQRNKDQKIDSDLIFAEVNTNKNPDFIGRVSEAQGRIPFKVEGVPTVLGYINGQFYSMYEDEQVPTKTYRSVDDTLEFGTGLGTAEITYV